MSRRQHHDHRSRSSNREPPIPRSDPEMAASEVLSPTGPLALRSHIQRDDAPLARQSRQIGGAIPLSSLLHESGPAASSLSTGSSEGAGQHYSQAGSTPGSYVSSAEEMEQMSPTRRTYFDPARDVESVQERPVAQDSPADPTAPKPSRFKLQIVQQPLAARACGHGERDRRVVDPPPILQLTLKDFDTSSERDRAELQHSHNVVHCKLYSAGSKPRDVSTITDPADPNKLIRSLMGMASSTPFLGIDPTVPDNLPEEKRLGVYFIFHDISCRHTGRYRLYFELASLSMDVGVSRNVVASVMSDVFEVYSAKDFPGMRPSSDLTRELKRQGASLPIKKGVDPKGSRRGKKTGRDESEDSSGDGQ